MLSWDLFIFSPTSKSLPYFPITRIHISIIAMIYSIPTFITSPIIISHSLIHISFLIAARKTLGFKYFRSMCDLVVATNNSKFYTFNPILVNLCGAVSAASFLYDVWK